MSPYIVFFSKIKENITEPGTDNAKENKRQGLEYYHGKSFGSIP